MTPQFAYEIRFRDGSTTIVAADSVADATAFIHDPREVTGTTKLGLFGGVAPSTRTTIPYVAPTKPSKAN